MTNEKFNSTRAHALREYRDRTPLPPTQPSRPALSPPCVPATVVSALTSSGVGPPTAWTTARRYANPPLPRPAPRDPPPTPLTEGHIGLLRSWTCVRSQLSAAGNLPFDSLQSPIQEVSVRVALANANTGFGKVLQEAEPVCKQIGVDTSFSVLVEIEVLKEHEVRQRQRQWAGQDLLLGALDIHDKHASAVLGPHVRKA